MKELIDQYKGLLLFMFAYWFICFLIFIYEVNFLYVMLAWNVLLSMLPLLFITYAEKTMLQGRIGRAIISLIFWLLFFPNSVYMVTDFVHISADRFMWIVETGEYALARSVVYSTELMVWVKLLVIGVGFLFSILVGLESLFILEQNVRKKFSVPVCYLGVLLVASLTGAGVYIGRFLRFNSWDVFLSPIQLLKQVAKTAGFAAQFSVAFTVFVLGCYALYRTFRGVISSENSDIKHVA